MSISRNQERYAAHLSVLERGKKSLKPEVKRFLIPLKDKPEYDGWNRAEESEKSDVRAYRRHQSSEPGEEVCLQQLQEVTL